MEYQDLFKEIKLMIDNKRRGWGAMLVSIVKIELSKGRTPYTILNMINDNGIKISEKNLYNLCFKYNVRYRKRQELELDIPFEKEKIPITNKPEIKEESTINLPSPKGNDIEVKFEEFEFQRMMEEAYKKAEQKRKSQEL